MNVCTIIAKNYVAHARVLARSLAEAQPGSRLQTLVIDDFSGYLDPSQEPFDILTPAQVGCEPFIHMAIRYSVLELSTAVKPWLLRHLLEVTGGPVTYLDPDIRVYGSLQVLDELAARHGVVLTPHNRRPIPQDDRHPSQVDVMIAGIYNLGYVSLASWPAVTELLDWWADRLIRDCRVDPTWGYFVDQRWFDLAPGFLDDLAIVRDPQYNLAYWNLHERPLERPGERYLVDGQPLGFFHFSGFDPERPLVLSRHQDRIDVLHQPVLEQLLSQYASEVMAEGHGVSRHWPYGWASFADGTRADERLRAAFDGFVDAHEGAIASPFTLEGVQAFDRWLAEPAPDAPAGINRALARVYEESRDVRGAFPDLSGTDRAGLLSWSQSEGLAEEPLLARAARTVAVPEGRRHDVTDSAAEPAGAGRATIASPASPLRTAPWGVNVVGDFRHEGCPGEIARTMMSAFDEAGLRALPILSQVGGLASGDEPYPAATPREAPFTVNVICLDPERLLEFVNHAGAGFFGGRHSVGLWCWPVERFPTEWSGRFSLVEEVWAPSAHVARALEPLATVPVKTVRVPVAPPPTSPSTRAELSLAADSFLFHSRVDYREEFERRNPLATVAAFGRAFLPGAGACLVLDCVHADQNPEAHARLRAAAESHPDIKIIEFDRTAESRSLTALCDAYVSLHRAEAFGLHIAEAMWFGKPVIATGYSGNLDFMTVDNSHLVDHQMVAVGPGHAPYPVEAMWAEPEREHAASLMRQLFDHRDRALALGAAAAESIRGTHSPSLAASGLRRSVDSIRATGRARLPADGSAAYPRPLARLPMRIRRGPGPAAAGRGQAARERLRQAVLRVIAPYSAYQQSINADLVAALTELSRNVDQARDETRAEWADMLAAARHFSGTTSQLDRQGEAIDEIRRMLSQDTDRGIYVALAELHRRHSRIGPEPGEAERTTELTAFELRVFSQNGEDGVLAEILRRIGAPERFFVEFGVESGREGNCVYLADVAGWRGLFLETDEQEYRRLARKYAAQGRVRTLRAKITPANVERLLEQAEVPAEPDVLSIDVNGQDYWIWESIQRFRPRVLVIEYNSALDPRRRMVQPDEPNRSWDGSDYYGASLGAVQALGATKGYQLVHTELSAVNAFFVRDDLMGAGFPAPDEIPVRGEPNFYQRGTHHPASRYSRPYLDLDPGKLGGRDPDQ